MYTYARIHQEGHGCGVEQSVAPKATSITMPFTLCRWASVPENDKSRNNPSRRKKASSELGFQEGTTVPDIDQCSVEAEPARTHNPMTPTSLPAEIVLSSDSDPPTRPKRRTPRFTTLSSTVTDPPALTQPTAERIDDSNHSISEGSAVMEMDSDDDQTEPANSPELPMKTKKRASSVLDENEDMRTQSKRIAILTTPDAVIKPPSTRNTRSSNRTGSAVRIKQMAPVTRSRMQAPPEAFTMLNKKGGETLQGTTASGTLAHEKNTTSSKDVALETSPHANRRRSKATSPAHNNTQKQATQGLQNTNIEEGSSAPETKSLSSSHQEPNPVCPVRARCHIAEPHYFHCTERGCNQTKLHRPGHHTTHEKAQTKSPQPIFVSTSPPHQPHSPTSSAVKSPPPSSPEPPQTAEVIGAASRMLMNGSRFLAQTSRSLSTPFDFGTIEPGEARQGMRRLRRTLRLWGTVESQIRTAFGEVIGEIEMLGKVKGEDA